MAVFQGVHVVVQFNVNTIAQHILFDPLPLTQPIHIAAADFVLFNNMHSVFTSVCVSEHTSNYR